MCLRPQASGRLLFTPVLIFTFCSSFFNCQHVSGYKFEVTNINRTQAGEYKCEASNECGNATETANIIVLRKFDSSFSLKVYVYLRVL